MKKCQLNLNINNEVELLEEIANAIEEDIDEDINEDWHSIKIKYIKKNIIICMQIINSLKWFFEINLDIAIKNGYPGGLKLSATLGSPWVEYGKELINESAPCK